MSLPLHLGGSVTAFLSRAEVTLCGSVWSVPSFLSTCSWGDRAVCVSPAPCWLLHCEEAQAFGESVLVSIGRPWGDRVPSRPGTTGVEKLWGSSDLQMFWLCPALLPPPSLTLTLLRHGKLHCLQLGTHGVAAQGTLVPRPAGFSA